ncbi:uncharacterized protein LOC108242272 isoform X1 [Kryptolebias marmoratus]|uniref:uncharacterized protein LOC108242272 isoform X1 n=1 Tax=Kryptolebias marmoratus TaxID=37003 RepID=UPI000D5307FE|nr:uncharacterized protein LOC108242272 isoform X1 [Kryptolebias marmoratus]
MGHTLLCMLGGFLLSTPFTGYAEDEPEPVLSVSPSWLSPGASVTLSCEVKPPSAGWRFFWYKLIPKSSVASYSLELLPGNSNGTQQNSYIVHRQKHTAGYVCRAGRGEPKTSKASFAWSADIHPAVSLTVTLNRVQHFSSDSVTLSCEGTSAEWRVIMFSETGVLFDCSSLGTMNGSSCTLNPLRFSGVYCCASGSGVFSHAINITKQDKDDGIILESPVHPVTEGDPVTLSCRLKQQKLLSDVFFYHNNTLLQNDGREELKISAVSKSDEGFYRCEHSGHESPQSWMSVQAVSSPVSSLFLVLLIVGPVIGVLLIILLILLWRCRQSKGRPHKPEKDATYSNIKTGNANIVHFKGRASEPDYCNVEKETKGTDSFNTSTGMASEADQDADYCNVEKETEGRPPEPDEDADYCNVETNPAGKFGYSATDNELYSGFR